MIWYDDVHSKSEKISVATQTRMTEYNCLLNHVKLNLCMSQHIESPSLQLSFPAQDSKLGSQEFKRYKDKTAR